ncbi:MAG: hypothetical protein OXT67_03360 [Zetaproteobacteria bacterium]|nr:hypothetical protein [Zetaproteobacteria bacterium]
MSKIKFVSEDLEQQVIDHGEPILSEEDTKDENLTLSVSIRINAKLLDKIKRTAQENHTKYQTLIKDVLEHKFGEGSDPLFTNRFDDLARKLSIIEKKIVQR